MQGFFNSAMLGHDKIWKCMLDQPLKEKPLPHKPLLQKSCALPMRIFYLCLGFVMVALGIIGALLPVMPTTIFLIVAAWCFARSSPKLEARLLSHPQFGPLIIKWQERGAIPPRVKLYACAGMLFGYCFFFWSAQPELWLAIAVAVFMLCSALYVLTRPAD